MPAYADIIRPSIKKHALIYEISLITGGVLLLSLSAQLAVRLTFSPVPITMQTLAVVLIGALYGSSRGAVAVASYVSAGAMGLPVFAGGAFGIAHLAGPTGGYLFGFIAAAWLTGFLAENGWDRKLWTSLIAMTAGTAAIFAFGIAWLGIFVGYDNVIALGLLPFIPGAIMKLAIASISLPTAWKFVGKRYLG